MKKRWRALKPVFVAITGSSGAGKSWLAAQLQARMAKEAALLSLDDFYRDRSHLSTKQIERVNFDHPRAIDWAVFEGVLRRCGSGRPLPLPRYDFKRHAPRAEVAWWRPKRIVLVEGLWLLRRPALRRLFALKVFLLCSASVRLRRRVERDTRERGRTKQSVEAQFRSRVLPMSEKHVEPQVRWADLVLMSPVDEKVLDDLEARIKRL
jgi:uridine kinase